MFDSSVPKLRDVCVLRESVDRVNRILSARREEEGASTGRNVGWERAPGPDTNPPHVPDEMVGT